MEIPEIKQLLAKYEKLPQLKKQKTYLELCRYPSSRFEEICSRLLCFYLSPQEEHGLKDLFLSSLLEVIKPDTTYINTTGTVEIEDEVYANGKRLDILIKTDTFVIGIENKILADLYNPLHEYSSVIELHKTREKPDFKIILSLRRITKAHEIDLMRKNGFLNITYHQYFSVIRKNIGNYLNGCDAKFLLHANDFLQTIENMDNLNIMNPEIDKFLFDNDNQLMDLTQLFKDYKNRILNKQKQQIGILLELIKTTTKNNWWAHEKWDLGINNLDAGNTLGVESSYQNTIDDALGIFRIYISTWNLQSWNIYEKELTEMYPNNEVIKTDGRGYLVFRVIHGNDEALIIDSLIQAYNLVISLINKKDSL